MSSVQNNNMFVELSQDAINALPKDLANIVKINNDCMKQVLSHIKSNSNNVIKVQCDSVSLNKNNNEKKQEQCCICLNNINNECNKVVTPCKHEFCFTCIQKHLSTSNKCPLCRTKIADKPKQNIKKIKRSDCLRLINELIEDTDFQELTERINMFPNTTTSRLTANYEDFGWALCETILEEQFNGNINEEEDEDDIEYEDVMRNTYHDSDEEEEE